MNNDIYFQYTFFYILPDEQNVYFIFELHDRRRKVTPTLRTIPSEGG